MHYNSSDLILKTQNLELKTQNLELRTQNLERTTHNWSPGENPFGFSMQLFVNLIAED